MRLHEIDQVNVNAAGRGIQTAGGNGENFASHLNLELDAAAGSNSVEQPGFSTQLAHGGPSDPAKASLATAVNAYQANAAKAKPPSSLQKYVEDQLLSNPGGDLYRLEEKAVEPSGRHSFAQRIGKDLADAAANMRNFFADFFLGAKICYRDEKGEIQEGRKKGLFGAIGDFFKDLGSFFSFGAWRPDGEAEPKGFWQRCKFSCMKLKEAVVDDLLKGVPASANLMAEDLVLTAWNTVETLPDATVGNFEGGEKATTAVFDGGQVVIDYATDIMPTGEAWQRVHASSLKKLKPPIVYNLEKPEHVTDDIRWRYVRNTRLRKAIETVGALAADVLTFGIIRWMTSSGGKSRHEQ